MIVRHVRTWVSILALITGLPATVAAQQTVSGTVTDASNGQPIANVQISVTGTLLGTLTTQDGKFTIASVPTGARNIVARRLGYATARQDITVSEGSPAEVNFSLTPVAKTLEEVVVSGVGAPAERRVVGNTVETVAGDEVSEAPAATSIDQALQGKITGAVISQNSGNPGGGVSIRLRGTNSILGGSEPLYVVDGVIVDNSSDALISLSANASRGNTAISNALSDLDPDDIERIEVLKGAAAAALYGSRANNGVIQIFTKRGRAGETNVTLRTEYALSKIAKRYDLNMSPFAGYADVLYGGADSIGEPIQRWDIQDEILRVGQGTSNQLSLSGGSGPTTYFVSGGYDYDQGIVRNVDYRRWNLRTNLSQRLSEKLDVGVRGSYTDSKANYLPEGEQTPGVLTSVIFTPTSVNQFFDKSTGRYPYNPILGPSAFDVMNNWEAPNRVTRMVGGFDVTARPTSSITLKYLAGIDDYRQDARFFQPPYSRSASFTGSVENPVALSRQFNNDFTATHVGDLGNSFGLTSTAGFRYASDRREVVRAAASDLQPGQDLVSGATQSASQSLTELRTLGFFLEERAAVADRLYLTAGVNYEASSAFGPDERWQFFPRVSASYVMGEEPWFQNSLGNTVSSLRLRAAYGETGGQPPGLYSRFANYVDLPFSGKPGLVASTLAGNDSLLPEREREYEFGFDAGFAKDRAQLEFTYYNRHVKDLVLAVPLPPSSGFSSQFQNIGELTNNGVEIALNTVNVSSPNFAWRSRISYARNRGKVTRLVTSADTLLDGYLNAVIEGQPVGVFYGGVFARNPDGTIASKPTDLVYNGRDTTVMLPYRAQDVLPSGALANASRIIGNPEPDFVATFGNTFDIGKRLQIGLLLDGRFGNDVANFSKRISQLFGADKSNEAEISGDTTFRAYTLNPNGRSTTYEAYIEDGTFVKLREISAALSFDDPWVRRFGAERLTLRLAGRNLYTWTDYSGLDPEVNMFSASTVSRGVDFATTPLPRQFTMSVSLNF